MKLRNLATVLTATLLLSGCSAAETIGAIPPPEVAFHHIHKLEVGQAEGELLVAAHDGLYRIIPNPQGEAKVSGPIGGFDFDLMGFAMAGGTAYASGHSGPKTSDAFGTPNLGLIVSTDLGETWINVSLTGSTDFHALAASTESSTDGRVYGIDSSKQRIQRSMDGGQTWSEGAEVVAREIVATGTRLYATTPDGLAVSDDHGTTFEIDSNAPGLFLVAAGAAGQLVGVDIEGNLWVRDAGGAWTTEGAVTGVPQAIAFGDDRVYVADDRGIAFTSDAGGTWTVLTLRS